MFSCAYRRKGHLESLENIITTLYFLSTRFGRCDLDEVELELPQGFVSLVNSCQHFTGNSRKTMSTATAFSFMHRQGTRKPQTCCMQALNDD